MLEKKSSRLAVAYLWGGRVFTTASAGFFIPMTYSEKLKDPRWQKKRLEILERANWACEDCGSKKKTLHVHHCFYVSRRQPWEYDVGLMAVCASCHTRRQSIEEDAHISLAIKLRFSTPAQIVKISKEAGKSAAVYLASYKSP